ncbi:MAG: OmpH family outer membrane protein [Candidatus Competibacteraceae bacterium]|nr:OmpH family outer membrane protein [Candidatus Competibacteraceae bacterium]
MKNLTMITQVVLAVAVLILFYLHFSSKNTSKQEKDITQTTADSPLKVLYVNSDSISAGYLLVRDLEIKFESDNKIREQKLQSKQATLQRMYKDYENKVMTMTTRERTKKEEEITNYQQQLMQEQQELGQLAAMQEAGMVSQMFDSLHVFFKAFAIQKGVDLILAYQKGSGVLYANEKFDVTGEALTSMNQRYEKSKASLPAEEK